MTATGSIIDDWYEKLRCPKCGRADGAVTAAEVEEDRRPTITIGGARGF
jgi:hypothetical protein